MSRKIAKEKITRTPIDEQKFVRIWARVHKDGGSLQEVADEVGCSYAGAKNKAERLVEEGVKLPELKKYRRSKRDVGALNDILKNELAKK